MVRRTSTYRPHGVLFGAAYYPEYHVSDRLELDLDLMKDAGFTVIRVGESVWSTWEPRDGEFDLEWLTPVLDAAHHRDIRVILGTPTYAVPPWLQTAHPEIAGEQATGVRIPWGARQEVDFTHPVFRERAERVIRAILGRHAQHPAVIGFQVDNEPGLVLFHNEGVFEGFVQSLRDTYGDVETLNREWGLTYWSHRISEWSQLWRPDGNSFPQYDLAWRRYQAGLTTEFIAWQAGLVDEFRREDQFVTTCIAYPRAAVADEELNESLDITAGNPYYGMQDRLDALKQIEPLSPWTTSGVAGLFRQADRMYSSKQSRYLVTETNAQSIGGSDMNYPPYPGQLAQAALAMISRGAAMIEYWHWHTLPYGTETYWGGVLPHSLVPGRVYRELAQLGESLGRIGDGLDGYEPDADVAILWSNASRFALQFSPPFRTGGQPDALAYEHIIDAFHRGAIESGRQARILHMDQAAAFSPADLAARFPVLIAAGLYITTDEDLAFLREYAAQGGHLVLGPRTGYADHEARARVEIAPPRLHDAAGVRYDEYSNLDEDVAVVGDAISESAAAQRWVDGLVDDGAEVIARYEHPRFGDFAAVTTNAFGAGRITVVGTVPSKDLAADVARWVAPAPTAAGLVEEASLPVTISSGTLPGGGRAWFLFNWGWPAQEVTLATSVTDLVTGDPFEAGTALSLEGWSTRAFVSR